MQLRKAERTQRGTGRWERSSMNPYVVDDITFTLSEIRRARAEAPVGD